MGFKLSQKMTLFMSSQDSFFFLSFSKYIVDFAGVDVNLCHHNFLLKKHCTFGSPWEANTVRNRSNGYDPTVAAHPASAPLMYER